jgi:hypothetical protein
MLQRAHFGRIEVQVGQHARAALLARHAGTGLQVPPGAEVAMRAVEHRHPRGVVLLERKKGGVQRARGVAVHRVAHVGAVQGDDEHRAGALGAHRGDRLG